MPIIYQQFGGLPTVIPPHEQHTPGRGPRSVAYPLLPQGVGLLPAASGECYTRPPPTDEEAGLRMKSSLGWKVGQGTQPGPVAMEQLHTVMSVFVVTTRHHHKGV